MTAGTVPHAVPGAPPNNHHGESAIAGGQRLAPLTPEECPPAILDISIAIAKAEGHGDFKAADIPDFVMTMARHGDLWLKHCEVTAQLFTGALEYRNVELALLRTAWLCKTPFVFAAHARALKRKCGCTSEDIERITLGSVAPGWDDYARAILRATEELHETAQISDETWAVLASRLTEKQLIELPILIGHIKGVCYVQNALRIGPMPGSRGLAER
jgi:alkylhydroperoxidase family enzyme